MSPPIPFIELETGCEAEYMVANDAVKGGHKVVAPKLLARESASGRRVVYDCGDATTWDGDGERRDVSHAAEARYSTQGRAWTDFSPEA